jgi:glycosyltransferase involved in cell wall biosynthesis
MDLDQVTPLILTYNEEPNIAQTLKAISWARSIIVVDSYSTDSTLQILSSFPNVTVIQRKFDHFADQCNFGLSNINTKWVLSLDADYICSDSLAQEIMNLNDSNSGYRAKFQYGVYGKALRASLYPPRTVLYEREKAHYFRDGHAHRVQIQGKIGDLASTILHDDRKPLVHWVQSQTKYAEHEATKLTYTTNSSLGWKDRVRKNALLAPVLTFLYCLFVKGLILDGRAGLHYTMQRVFAELILSLTILDQKLRMK